MAKAWAIPISKALVDVREVDSFWRMNFVLTNMTPVHMKPRDTINSEVYSDSINGLIKSPKMTAGMVPIIMRGRVDFLMEMMSFLKKTTIDMRVAK
jgi:hypothetical protein